MGIERLGKERAFDKRILVLVSSSRTQCFRIKHRLHKSLPCSRQSINWYHSAWCTPIRILIQGLQGSRLYPGFTELPSIQDIQSSHLSRVYRVPVSIQDLQSSRLYPGITEFPSIKGLQSSRLYPRFTDFSSIQCLQSSHLSRVYRVPVSIQGLQSSRPYLRFTEFPSIQGLQSSLPLCHAVPHRVLFTTRNWRELYKNLTVLSSLDAYT